jgi:ribosomal protein S27E
LKKEGYTLRCMRCLGGRIIVPWAQGEIQCPHCGQEWRITWVTPEVAKIRGKVLRKETQGGTDSLHRPQ